MKTIENIRKVLETHRIGTNRAEYVQKCAGCPWIGWNHDQHLAEVIHEDIWASLCECEPADDETQYAGALVPWCPLHGEEARRIAAKYGPEEANS